MLYLPFAQIQIDQNASCHVSHLWVRAQDLAIGEFRGGEGLEYFGGLRALLKALMDTAKDRIQTNNLPDTGKEECPPTPLPRVNVYYRTATYHISFLYVVYSTGIR